MLHSLVVGVELVWALYLARLDIHVVLRGQVVDVELVWIMSNGVGGSGYIRGGG
jgi:hypothetical protein